MADEALRVRVSLAIVLALLAGTVSCDGKPVRPAGIVLITLDTTRADHLGCYGAGAAETPNLDAFATGAVRFDQAMSAVPTTLASHATMFTGEYPPVHGVRYNGMFKLGDASVTIAERLKEAGFSDAEIARIHCPIGINIGAQSPQEIAISIMAELVLALRGPKVYKPA